MNRLSATQLQQMIKNSPANSLNADLFGGETGKVSDREPKAAGSEEKGVSKYGNQKTQEEGIRFDSKKEATRYKQLRMLLNAGKITWLARQVEFSLRVNGGKVASYFADFVYWDAKEHFMVVEDVKGFKTPVYQLKKKLMKRIYQIEIAEV